MPESPQNILEYPDNQKPEMSIDLNDGSQEQVSIVIVHHDRPEYLNLCVQSIAVCSNLNNYEIIIVDNGSGQETQEYLDVLQSQGIKVIRNKTNEYWSKAANQGAAAADPNSRFFVFMHADVVVLDPSWLDLLINIALARDAGIVGTQLASYYISKQKADFIPEWCILFRKDCWNDCGPWPEELPLIGNSFIMTVRAQYRGYKPQVTQNPVVAHYKAFSGDPNEFDQLSEQAYSKLPKMIQQAQVKGQ